MKTKMLITVAAALLLWARPVVAAEPTEAAKGLRELITKVQTKLKAGDRTEAALADELKEFDALLAKHKGEKTDDVAQILFMKAQLYSQVFENETKGEELLEQLKTEFPDSKPVAMLKKQEEAQKIQSAWSRAPSFPTSTRRTWRANRSTWPPTKGRWC